MKHSIEYSKPFVSDLGRLAIPGKKILKYTPSSGLLNPSLDYLLNWNQGCLKAFRGKGKWLRVDEHEWINQVFKLWLPWLFAIEVNWDSMGDPFFGQVFLCSVFKRNIVVIIHHPIVLLFHSKLRVFVSQENQPYFEL